MKKIVLFCLFFLIPSFAYALTDSEIVNILTNSGFEFEVLQNQGNTIFQFIDPTCFVSAFYNFIDIMQDCLYLVTVALIVGWGVSFIIGAKVDLIENFKNLTLIFGLVTAIIPILNVIYGSDAIKKLSCDLVQVDTETINKLQNIYSNGNMFVTMSNEEVNIDVESRDDVSSTANNVSNSSPVNSDVLFNRILNEIFYHFEGTGLDESVKNEVARYGIFSSAQCNCRSGRSYLCKKYNLTTKEQCKNKIINLTQEEARDFYYNYWYPMGNMKELPNLILPVVFIQSVGVTPKGAIGELQTVLGVGRTGNVNNQTLSAISNYSGDLFLDVIEEHKIEQCRRYPSWCPNGKPAQWFQNRLDKTKQRLRNLGYN